MQIFFAQALIKVFAEGVMEYPAQTAAMLSPYLDADGKPTKALGRSARQQGQGRQGRRGGRAAREVVGRARSAHAGVATP